MDEIFGVLGGFCGDCGGILSKRMGFLTIWRKRVKF